MGAALYYSYPPMYNTLNFIGAIANERPSDIFHTGFALNPEVNTQSEIKLVVSLKTFGEIEELVKLSKETDL